MADYATITEVKSRIQKTNADGDTTLTALATAASRAIDNYTNRPDGYVAPAAGAARLFSGSGLSTLRIDECVAVSLVEVKDSITDTSYTAWAAGDYIKAKGDPLRPDFNGLPYDLLIVDPTGDYSTFTGGRYGGMRGFRSDSDAVLRGLPTVRVTARWGYAATVPATIKEACCMQMSRWYKRFQSSMADTVGMPDIGELLYTKILDPDVQFLLRMGRFIRPAIG